MSQQDDKQLGVSRLRIEIEDIVPISVDNAIIAKLEALFTTAQLQLVSELEGELPLKKMGVTFATGGFNEAIDYVTALLEHKKQELEGKTDV